MALNKDVLGAALKAKADSYNNVAPENPADLETIRTEFWKGVAEEIINHIKTAGVVNTTGSSSAQTGTMI